MLTLVTINSVLVYLTLELNLLVYLTEPYRILHD